MVREIAGAEGELAALRRGRYVCFRGEGSQEGFKVSAGDTSGLRLEAREREAREKSSIEAHEERRERF